MEYIYYEDEYLDIEIENEACYEEKSLPPPVTHTPSTIPWFCNDFCHAEM